MTATISLSSPTRAADPRPTRNDWHTPNGVNGAPDIATDISQQRRAAISIGGLVDYRPESSMTTRDRLGTGGVYPTYAGGFMRGGWVPSTCPLQGAVPAWPTGRSVAVDGRRGGSKCVDLF